MKDKPIYPDLRITDSNERTMFSARQMKLNEGMTLLEHYAGLDWHKPPRDFYMLMTGENQKWKLTFQEQAKVLAAWKVCCAKALIAELEKEK